MTLFSKLKPKDAKNAIQWFKNLKAEDMDGLMADATYQHRMTLGHMYTFYYDPKGKDDLPYYDQWPLIFPTLVEDTFFIGINFHYLDHGLRAKLMDALYENVSKDRMEISIEILKSESKFALYKPAIRRYNKDRLRSRLVKIEPHEWELALSLPTERFVKATNSTVWSDSKSKI